MVHECLKLILRIFDVISYMTYIIIFSSRYQQVPSIETHNMDLADWKATRELIQNIGTVDLLVNNAAILKVTPFLEVTKDDFDR